MTEVAPSPRGRWFSQPRIGIVSSCDRLCGALGRPLHEGATLLAEQVAGAAASGVEFFQVREPGLGAAELLGLVRRLRAVSQGRVRIVVNDRADVAAAAGVALHLKGASMAIARVRPWLPPATWISGSAHDEAEVSAMGEVDALLVGTVRDTLSKTSGTVTLGVSGLARVAAAANRPVFAIGGVAAAHWPHVAGAGAVGIAAIGWMLPVHGEGAAEGVARAMRDLRAVVDGGLRVP